MWSQQSDRKSLCGKRRTEGTFSSRSHFTLRQIGGITLYRILRAFMLKLILTLLITITKTIIVRVNSHSPLKPRQTIWNFKPIWIMQGVRGDHCKMLWALVFGRKSNLWLIASWLRCATASLAAARAPALEDTGPSFCQCSHNRQKWKLSPKAGDVSKVMCKLLLLLDIMLFYHRVFQYIFNKLQKERF